MQLGNCHRTRIEVRPTALLRYHADTCWTLSFDLHIWPWLLVQGELWSWPTETKTHVQRSVGSKYTVKTIGWTDRQTDRRTLPITVPSRLTRSVG